MPETREILVYAFGELAEPAKSRVRETIGQWLQESANEGLADEFAAELVTWGFPTDNVEWSLGSCQGDGVAFYGRVDLPTYARKLGKLTAWRAFLLADPYAELSRNSWGTHYSHANTMDVDVFYDGTATAKRNALAQVVSESLTDDVRAVSRELERRGYAALEFEDADIQDHCAANDYRFYADGRIAE